MTARRGGEPRLAWTGAVAAAGAAILILTDLVGSALAPGYDPIADSISDLAAGRLSWIQDFGLVAFAIGLAALAAGLARTGEGRLWTTGVVLLALLAADVAVIAIHDEYGDGEPGGLVLHLELVYLLGGLFAAATLCLAPGLWRERRAWGAFDAAIAGLWIVLAPIFFFVPTPYDGAYERGIALLVLAWTFGMAWRLGRRRRRVALT
jgi:hypothetical membrane protein